MTAMPHHLRPALDGATGPSGRYNARRVAELMGVSLRELAALLGRDVSALSRAPESVSLQEPLRPLVTVLDLVGRTGASGDAVRAWLRSPIPGLGYAVPLELLRSGRHEALVQALRDALEGNPD